MVTVECLLEVCVLHRRLPCVCGRRAVGRSETLGTKACPGVPRRPGMAEAIAEPLACGSGGRRGNRQARPRLDRASAVHPPTERNAVVLESRATSAGIRS